MSHHPHPIHAPDRCRRRTLVAGALVAVSALVLSACWSANQGKVLDQINAARKANRAAAVSGNQQAMAKAQAWSEHMARTGRLEHTGGGSKVDPSGLPKWCAVAENVGRGPSTEAVHQSFLGSPEHRTNMLGNYNRVGTGVARKGNVVWVTQIFYRAC